jgi:hypothetical protein
MRITFSLFGIPDNASGSREERTFWMIVDVAATPQTVPIDRKRYTMEVETACSAIISRTFQNLRTTYEIVRKKQC